ncbi:9 [Durusdinium trenchii]|uniref:11-endoperoxide prostaglandin H2 reductase (Prostaglandin F2-alpha synthase) n=1 Tax=Durusdinium trenchii TaxID=1381693 RepID=A0ABP0IGJ7_9DINO
MATNQHETCQAFQDLDVFPEGVPVVCNKEANDTSHEAHAKRVRDFYAQKVQAWAVAEGLCANQTARATQSAGDCKAAGASVVSKGENCTEIQRMLDDLACEAWTEHYDCEKKSVSCLFQARQRYLDANRTGARTDEDLQSQWRAVKRIECLLDAMEQSEDMNHALEECRSKSHDASPIALSYPFYQDWAPQMPDVSECKQPRFPPPGSATYPKQVYDLAQGESFAECTAECCSRCQFFTCNSTTVLKPNAKLLHGFSQAQCCEAMPQVHWRAEEWPNVNCPTECGLQTMTQTRRVVCWDVANQVEAEESLCTSTKPSSFRVSCPATPSCRSCQATKCPNGFTAKADAPEICTGATCLPEECCNRVCSVGDCPAGWVLKANATCGSATCTRGDCCSVTQWSFNEWTDVMCDSSCGQPEQIETRLVRCRVEGMVQGDVSFVRDDACVAPKPVTSRVGPALWFRGAAGSRRIWVGEPEEKTWGEVETWDGRSRWLREKGEEDENRLYLLAQEDAPAAQWAAKQIPEACDGPDGGCQVDWDQVAATWRYAWNNLRLSLQHAAAKHRLRLDPGEVQRLVAVHEFMYWLGEDKKKWQVGWDEMSGAARALLRALQLWLVSGEYQWGSPVTLLRANHGLHLPFPQRSVLVPTDGDLETQMSLMNGLQMPLLIYRLGPVWEFPFKTKIYEKVREALQLGYRHLDFSEHYGAEKEVVRAIQDSGVPREALFLAGKLSAADHYPLGALRAVQQQMKHLDLTYLDLFMLTKPIYDPAVLRAVWEILESYHHRGIFRSLGVSNFDLVSLELLEQVAKVPPVYLQNRFSLYDVQGFEALAWAKRRGLAMAARLEQSLLSPWEDPHVLSIARRWNRSSQELLSRWLLQLGCAIVAPASAAEDHAGALSFQMPEEDMRQLGGLISLSSSVPGVGPPSWMEDVYGLARFGPPAVLGVTGANVPELHGFSKPFAYRAPVAKENGRPARRLRGSRGGGVATKARKAFLGPRFRHRLTTATARQLSLRPPSSAVKRHGELAETRGVQCEGAEAAPLPQSRCTGLKPLERRVICPATPPCETSAAAPATTLAPTTTLAPMTTSATLPATEAAKVGSWVAPAWSTPDCARRCCGLGELTEERSVLCMDCNGRLLPECVFPLDLEDDPSMDTFEVIGQLEAEALARADAGKLLLLFGGALAVTYAGAQVITKHLSAEAPQKSIAFRAPVASMAKAHDHGRVVVTLHATTEEAPRCAALVLSIAEDGTCRVVHETSLPGQRLFLSTALSTEKTAKVVAYRPVREASQSYIELLAVQMELAELELSPEAKILWTARGPHAPVAVHWASDQDVLIISSGSFQLSSSPVPSETEHPVLSIFHDNQVEHWPLPPGELLAAWTSTAGLHVALAEPMGGALIFQLVAHPPEPRNITALPGAGACAAARACGTSAGARLVVAPEFFALVEVDQRGVSLYRNPQGTRVAPLASLAVLDPPVLGLAIAAQDALVLRSAQSIIHCTIDLAVKVEVVKRPLISREQMPLGMDPEALLKMLDARGED